VGKAAQLIARERGLREDRVEIVHYAGMLHDVGKLGVPTRVLQKQGKLNDEEFDAIKLHPLRGYEMLAEIDFLTEALSGVYHHHERMDGRGYPMGLVDDEIPEIARIIMVADAFDSMTSTRSYRQAKTVAEAFTELRRCEGIQFDPGVVSCLEAAVAKHGWEPHAETYFGEQVTRDGRPIAYSDTHDPDPDLVELRLLMGERGRGGG
jgi:HD-GYP domain-containing protein (c-di-GMP phosphodiesterase class II)